MLIPHFSATLRVPSTAKSAALTAPPPIPLYEAGERVVDVERSLCLPSLPSVTGVVCVPKAWRHVKHKALDKSWLERIRNTLIEQLCAQLEELDDAKHTAIMRAFKPQFCVRLIMVFFSCMLQIIAGSNRWTDARAPVDDAARAALSVVGVKRQNRVAPHLPLACSEVSADRQRQAPELCAQHDTLCARLLVRCRCSDAARRARQDARRSFSSTTTTRSSFSARPHFKIAHLRRSTSAFWTTSRRGIAKSRRPRSQSWLTTKKQACDIVFLLLPTKDFLLGCVKCPARYKLTHKAHPRTYHPTLKDCAQCPRKNIHTHAARRPDLLSCSNNVK